MVCFFVTSLNLSFALPPNYYHQHSWFCPILTGRPCIAHSLGHRVPVLYHGIRGHTNLLSNHVWSCCRPPSFYSNLFLLPNSVSHFPPISFLHALYSIHLDTHMLLLIASFYFKKNHKHHISMKPPSVILVRNNPSLQYAAMAFLFVCFLITL